MENKKYLIGLVQYFLIGVTIASIGYTIYFYGAFDTDFKKDYELSILAKHFVENDLNLIDENIILDTWASDFNLTSWHEFIIEKYHYSKYDYNCKYWALMWALYCEKHEIDYDFIEPTKHILVLLKFNESYCLADGKILDCYYYM